MTAPEMISVEELPLHEGDLPREECFWACERPESPHTPFTWYDLRCRACLLAGEATVRNGGDITPDYNLDHGILVGNGRLLSEALALGWGRPRRRPSTAVHHAVGHATYRRAAWEHIR